MRADFPASHTNGLMLLAVGHRESLPRIRCGRIFCALQWLAESLNQINLGLGRGVARIPPSNPTPGHHFRDRLARTFAISIMISRSFRSMSPSRKNVSRSRCAARSLVRPIR